MKNIQVRVDDELKESSDKLFQKLGTTTNEAIKIFLQMSKNNEGFPFELKLDKTTDLLEWVEEHMLPIDEKTFMDAYMSIEGSYQSDADFGVNVVNENIEIKGILDVDDDNEVLMASADVKIINNFEVDTWDAADAASGDFELVASELESKTDLYKEVNKIAFLDEFFVFSKQVTAKNRVKLFFDQVIPYLVSRDVEVVAFMNAGFWRTDAIEEQKALTDALDRPNIFSLPSGKDWVSSVSYIQL
ncbi:type II toxin-antitoxin system RelB/DinJ family antitoxin [Companilactobacillus insicii]|uniref:type II toxin-antitoxin system RelB/DinJ family antitoxin n=1 Tax=Companilactobacillus insicii TaxID=1732567 RepID=UPI000F76A2B7|nr:type II toxin-antitoxin system RelB/DinJ family antitoxin [Companilactobacillus insicii]